MPELVLDAFQSSITMSTYGDMEASAVPVITTDATAVFTVSIDAMKDVFKFKSDSADCLDANASDLKYFVHMENWPTLVAANAMMDHLASTYPIASGFAANKMLVAHDFVRYLALELFGTYHGVDLFNNEVALLQNLRLLTGSGAAHTMGDISTKLTAVSTAGTHANITVDAGGNYMTNSSSADSNICRKLFEQLAYMVPERFAALQDVNTEQNIPLEIGDVISFKVTIAPKSDQHLLTDVPALSARSYKIKLLMTAAGSVSNTSPDASELPA